MLARGFGFSVRRGKKSTRGIPMPKPGALEMQIRGGRLATAEIIYHMPDFPGLLQTFVWQHYDVAPHFPRLHRFLDYWKENLDGKLHSVTVDRAELIAPGEIRAGHIFRLH